MVMTNEPHPDVTRNHEASGNIELRGARENHLRACSYNLTEFVIGRWKRGQYGLSNER